MALERLSEAVLCAAPYSQARLFEGKSSAVKDSLVQQLNDLNKKIPGGGLSGYLERARTLLANAQKGANPFEGMTPNVPSGERLTGDTGPGSTTYAELERLGMAGLEKCAFCIVAGGLGERLGYPGIKIGIISEVTTGVTFIEFYISFILAFQAHARKTSKDESLELPFAIMTSGDTDEQTRQLLKFHNNFGMSESQLTIITQEQVPALLDIDANISALDGKIETKPHGHGDVHALLYEAGLPKKWVDAGKEWLVVFQDTNPLAFRCLCAFLGVSIKNSFVMNTMTVPRKPGEKVGGIAALKNAKTGKTLTINVEYNELDPLLKSTGGDVADKTGFSPYPGNTNILAFKLPEMAKCLDATYGIVTEFINPKWADEKKKDKFKSSARLECMMQDFPKLCTGGEKIGVTQLDRLMCFSCLKNNLAEAAKKNPPDCALSVEADIYGCNARLLELAGTDVKIEPPENVSFLGVKAKIGARIILKPAFGISLEQMKERVKGKIQISKKSVLVVEGPATIEGLELDGAVTIWRSGVVQAVNVKNESQPLIAIPNDKMAIQPESLKIRGYTMAAGKMEIIETKSRRRGSGTSTCCCPWF